MAHDFKQFPELTNSQMQVYYFESPHKQIMESFNARVVKVTDGDTIRVTCDFRDFDFPIRLASIAAPELKEGGGRESKSFLDKLLGEEVEIQVNPNNRVGKWGRLLGDVIFQGINMNNQSMDLGYSVRWADREGKLIPEVGDWL